MIMLISLAFNSLLLVKQGGTVQVRFQPNIGQYLAAAAENVVSIFDVETDRKIYTFQVFQYRSIMSITSFFFFLKKH